MFSCADCLDCRFYKAEGWAFLKANEIPIPEGPCFQYSFYNWEAARNVCGGDLKEKTKRAEDHQEGMAGK